jgi:hypothetical protein
MGHDVDEKEAIPVENTTPPPSGDSYDSGYEHSWQHWLAVRELVEEAD